MGQVAPRHDPRAYRRRRALADRGSTRDRRFARATSGACADAESADPGREIGRPHARGGARPRCGGSAAAAGSPGAAASRSTCSTIVARDAAPARVPRERLADRRRGRRSGGRARRTACRRSTCARRSRAAPCPWSGPPRRGSASGRRTRADARGRARKWLMWRIAARSARSRRTAAPAGSCGRQEGERDHGEQERSSRHGSFDRPLTMRLSGVFSRPGRGWVPSSAGVLLSAAVPRDRRHPSVTRSGLSHNEQFVAWLRPPGSRAHAYPRGTCGLSQHSARLSRIGAARGLVWSRAMPPVPRRDWSPPSRRRVRALRDRLRLVYGRPIAPPHRPAARRADPHRPLPVDERPQPRRRLPAPARALPGLGGGARRAATRRSRRRSGPAGSRRSSRCASRRSCASSATRPSLDHLADADVAAARDELVRAARRRPQDRGLRAAVRLRHARRAGRHARLARRHAARPVPARARRSRSCTTTCSRSRRAGRSSSSTSTCCATAAGRATRSGPKCPECALRRMCPWAATGRERPTYLPRADATPRRIRPAARQRAEVDARRPARRRA